MSQIPVIKASPGFTYLHENTGTVDTIINWACTNNIASPMIDHTLGILSDGSIHLHGEDLGIDAKDLPIALLILIDPMAAKQLVKTS